MLLHGLWNFNLAVHGSLLFSESKDMNYEHTRHGRLRYILYLAALALFFSARRPVTIM
ncbi:MAG: hypothetical protein JW821_18185 [Deltaproteobacteria bacterium]|nr:hypothetical protein [Deltaproteobacteria bacterium]